MAISERHQPTRTEAIRAFVENAAITFLVRKAADIFNRVPIHYIPEAQHAYIAAKQEGCVTVRIYSHQVHLDALGAGVVDNSLRRLETSSGIPSPTKGQLLTIAESVKTGHQGRLLQEGYKEMEPILRSLGTRPITYVRPEDTTSYNLSTNSVAVGKTLLRGVDNGYGIGLFLEGKVEAGRLRRKKKSDTHSVLSLPNTIKEILEDWGVIDGEINGMQRFNGALLAQVKRSIERHGKKVAFVPVAIDGVYRLTIPNHDHTVSITPRGVVATLVPLDLRFVSLSVGITETGDAIREKISGNTPEKINQHFADYLGYRVADMLPAGARGVYR